MKIKSVVLLASTACVAVAWMIAHFCTSEAASLEGFVKITDGMSETDVRALLGEPDPGHMHRDSRGRTRYFYGGFPRFKWCSMEVFFGSDGLVNGKFHDH